MSQTLYIKQGRKYVPVREHAPEVHDSLPFGQYVVTVSEGCTRLKRVDTPASAEVLAAVEQMREAMETAMREAELLRKLEQQTDWYQQRFNALRQWVNSEVRPLSEEAANRYFSIVANGSPAPHEQADWRETMHGLTMRAFMAERQRDSLVAVLVRLFEWEDKTYAHAVMHVENAVNNLRSDLATANSERLVAEATTWEKADQAIAAQDEILTRKYNEQLARAKRAEDENAAIRLAIETFAQSVDDAERHWEGPRGGQHVPYHGDWACAVPSVRQRLEWWARHLRDAAKEGEG